MIDLSKIKLGIALPNTSETYPSKFVDSFCAITKPKHLYIRPTSQGPIDTVRNDLVLLALMNECTHIWMADTDQVYPQDVLMRMLEHDKDIIAAKVHRRRPPYDPILYRGTLDNFTNVPDEEWSKGELIEVDATGFGSVLIKMSVFESIELGRNKYIFIKLPNLGGIMTSIKKAKLGEFVFLSNYFLCITWNHENE